MTPPYPTHVICPDVDGLPGYLTAGKRYEVYNPNPEGFYITDDDGTEEMFMEWTSDADLNGADWIIPEAGKEPEEHPAPISLDFGAKTDLSEEHLNSVLRLIDANFGAAYLMQKARAGSGAHAAVILLARMIRDYPQAIPSQAPKTNAEQIKQITAGHDIPDDIALALLNAQPVENVT